MLVETSIPGRVSLSRQAKL